MTKKVLAIKWIGIIAAVFIFSFVAVTHTVHAGSPTVVLPWGNAYDYSEIAQTVMPDACNPAMGGSIRNVYDGFATYGLYSGAYDAGPCQNTPSPSQLTRLITANTNITTACGSALCGLVTWGHSKQQYLDTASQDFNSSTGNIRETDSDIGSFACIFGVGAGTGTCVTPSSTPHLNGNFKFWPCAGQLKETSDWISDAAESLYSGCLSSVISPDGGTDAEVQAVWGLHITLVTGRIANSGLGTVSNSGSTFTLTGTNSNGIFTCTPNGSKWYGTPIVIDGQTSRIALCPIAASQLTLAIPITTSTCNSGCSGVPWSVVSYNNGLNNLPNNGPSAAYYEALVSAWGIRYYKASQWTNTKIHYFSSEYQSPCVGYVMGNTCKIAAPQDDFENAWSDQMLVDSQVNEMGTQATSLTLTRGGSGNKTVTVTSSSTLPSIVVPPSAMFPTGTTLGYTTGEYVHVLSTNDPTYNTPCIPAQCSGAVITSVSSSSFTYQLSSAPTSAFVSDGYATVVPDPTGIESLECGNNNCALENGTSPVLAWGPYEYVPTAPAARVDGWNIVPPDSYADLTHPSFVLTGCDGTRTLTNSANTFNNLPQFSTFPGYPWTSCSHTGGLTQEIGTIAMNFFTNCNLQNGCTPPWGGPVTSSTINGVGSGYAVGNTFYINKVGGSLTGRAIGKVTGIGGGGSVNSYTIIFTGDSYSTSTGIATTNESGTGSGLTVNITAVGTYGYGPTGAWTSWICDPSYTKPGCQQ